jgi:hypothetical protein
MFLRPFNIRDPRYFLPLLLAILVVWLIDLHWLHETLIDLLSRARNAGLRGGGKALVKGALAVALVGIFSFHGVHAFRWGLESFTEGTGYSNASWHSSQLVKYIRGLPEETPVLSNAYDAIYMLTGREIYPLPNDGSRRETDTGMSSQEAWEQMTTLLRYGGASLVVFREATRQGMVDEGQIEKEIPICPILEYPEGRVYVWCGQE